MRIKPAHAASATVKRLAPMVQPLTRRHPVTEILGASYAAYCDADHTSVEFCGTRWCGLTPERATAPLPKPLLRGNLSCPSRVVRARVAPGPAKSAHARVLIFDLACGRGRS